MLVHDFLRRSAERAPDATAIIEPDASATYGELNDLSTRAANAMLAAGVRRGDRVVLAVDDGIESVACYFGAMKAGGVAVPLPHGPHNDRFPRAVADCSPAAAIVNPATADDADAAAVLQRLPAVFVTDGPRGARRPGLQGFPSWTEAVAAAADQEPAVRLIDLDLAAIIYTSGSTGAPRGAMLSHLNIRSNTESIVEYLHLTAADRVMCVLPFYYVYGLSLLHTHVAVGGSVIVDTRFAFPNVVLKAMRELRATGFAGVPSTFALLMHRSNLRNLQFPDLRYVTQAGGGMPPARIREWLEKGPRAAFYVMYGATEASARLTYLEPADLERKLGSIGRGIPNVEMLVVDDDGRRLPPGEVGELVARGSNISPGYWNNPLETSERFGALGYRTGDLGYADDEGFLFLVGRKHDMIKVGAHRVGAKEIEDVLNEHPAISEAAVVPVPHELLGEAPFAFITTRDRSTPDIRDILAFCHSRLPPQKVPVEFVVLPSIPKSGIGKIDKLKLRSMAGDRKGAGGGGVARVRRLIVRSALVWLAGAALLSAGCGGSAVEERATRMRTIEDVSPAAVAALRHRRIFFGHQSVGGNIVEGLIEGGRNRPAAALKVVSLEEAAAEPEGFFAHAKVGRNGRPDSKTDAFAGLIDGALGSRLDVALHKYCYADVNERTDVRPIFEHYRETMARLRAAHPAVTFVHVTMPLMAVQSGPKAAVKKLLGRPPDHYLANFRREQFNELMRREYAGKEPLFDLAAAEAADERGDAVRISFGGETGRALFAPLTTDGGHLNEAGRRRVAGQLFAFLAELPLAARH